MYAMTCSGLSYLEGKSCIWTFGLAGSDCSFSVFFVERTGNGFGSFVSSSSEEMANANLVLSSSELCSVYMDSISSFPMFKAEISLAAFLSLIGHSLAKCPFLPQRKHLCPGFFPFLFFFLKYRNDFFFSWIGLQLDLLTFSCENSCTFLCI